MHVQTESKLEFPMLSAPGKKPKFHCPKCGSTRIVLKESTKKAESSECSSCGYAWSEMKTPKAPNKARCVTLMAVVVVVYVVGVDLVSQLTIGMIPSEAVVLLVLLVISASHESLHALARRFFGYRAIPIPIPFPLILGICIGPKPQRELERFAVGLAPILLTIANFSIAAATGSGAAFFLGIFNLFCMACDVLPLLLPSRRRYYST